MAGVRGPAMLATRHGAVRRHDWPARQDPAGGENTMLDQRTATASQGTALRPFVIDVPQADLDDLRRRIAATRFPEKETVADQSQGTQLATSQALARYWATEYDWRKVEARLNSYPQFITEIDGLDIHFIHVRSKHEYALPLIVTHGGRARSSNS